MHKRKKESPRVKWVWIWDGFPLKRLIWFEGVSFCDRSCHYFSSQSKRKRRLSFHAPHLENRLFFVNGSTRILFVVAFTSWSDERVLANQTEKSTNYLPMKLCSLSGTKARSYDYLYIILLEWEQVVKWKNRGESENASTFISLRNSWVSFSVSAPCSWQWFAEERICSSCFSSSRKISH